MRQMKVDKLGIDLLTHDPVVILKDMDGSHYLPILIGPFEATAIALALEGAPVPRPLSHDLMRNILETLSANLEQVVIHDIKDSTFFAKLVVRKTARFRRSTRVLRTVLRSRCACPRRSSFRTRSFSKRPPRKRSPSTIPRWRVSRNFSRISNRQISIGSHHLDLRKENGHVSAEDYQCGDCQEFMVDLVLGKECGHVDRDHQGL